MNCYGPDSKTSRAQTRLSQEGGNYDAFCRIAIKCSNCFTNFWCFLICSSSVQIIQQIMNIINLIAYLSVLSPSIMGIYCHFTISSIYIIIYLNSKNIFPSIKYKQMTGLGKQTYDYMFKVIVIGDSGVGKTNLILRFSDKNFNNNYVATIGVDFKIKTITIGDKRVRLQLWDTAGQQRFRTITQTYYKGAAGIVLTYSIDDRKTFDNISKWMKQIKEKTPPHVQKLILANKCDLQSERKVSYDEGVKLAQELSDENCKVQFLEVSAKTGKNVMQAFSKISQQIKEYVEANQTAIAPKSSVIRIQNQNSQKDGCLC